MTEPLSNLLNKDVAFVFNEECMEAFNDLKTKLVSTPVITTPDWGQEFELMCDASDYVVGAVLVHQSKSFPLGCPGESL